LRSETRAGPDSAASRHSQGTAQHVHLKDRTQPSPFGFSALARAGFSTAAHPLPTSNSNFDLNNKPALFCAFLIFICALREILPYETSIRLLKLHHSSELVSQSLVFLYSLSHCIPRNQARLSISRPRPRPTRCLLRHPQIQQPFLVHDPISNIDKPF